MLPGPGETDAAMTMSVLRVLHRLKPVQVFGRLSYYYYQKMSGSMCAADNLEQIKELPPYNSLNDLMEISTTPFVETSS